MKVQLERAEYLSAGKLLIGKLFIGKLFIGKYEFIPLCYRVEFHNTIHILINLL
ncbi:MAG: hypothetical protein LBE18_12410 [Planctomycetaceae bacterium]|nr:hypothetical protein [Planctomycetaceae bacterium]